MRLLDKRVSSYSRTDGAIVKTWTVVIEIQDRLSGGGVHWDKQSLEEYLSSYLSQAFKDTKDSFQIFECTEAPYGPQGVVLKDAKL